VPQYSIRQGSMITMQEQGYPHRSEVVRKYPGDAGRRSLISGGRRGVIYRISMKRDDCGPLTLQTDDQGKEGLSFGSGSATVSNGQ
jgi:hypothetical protein